MLKHQKLKKREKDLNQCLSKLMKMISEYHQLKKNQTEYQLLKSGAKKGELWHFALKVPQTKNRNKKSATRFKWL